VWFFSVFFFFFFFSDMEFIFFSQLLE